MSNYCTNQAKTDDEDNSMKCLNISYCLKSDVDQAVGLIQPVNARQNSIIVNGYCRQFALENNIIIHEFMHSYWKSIQLILKYNVSLQIIKYVPSKYFLHKRKIKPGRNMDVFQPIPEICPVLDDDDEDDDAEDDDDYDLQKSITKQIADIEIMSPQIEKLQWTPGGSYRKRKRKENFEKMNDELDILEALNYNDEEVYDDGEGWVNNNNNNHQYVIKKY